MLDPFQSFQVVPKMINSDQTKSCILICFMRWMSSTQRLFIGFFRIAKPTILSAMLMIIFWRLNIVKTTSKKTRALKPFYEVPFTWSCSLSLCCKVILSVRSEPIILCRNVIKLVKYDLCFKHVEGALTNRLNLFHFFIFADFFLLPEFETFELQDIYFWLAREMLELKKHLVLFSPFKSVSFFFFSIFLTLVTLYLEVFQDICMECTKFDKKALIRFYCTS